MSCNCATDKQIRRLYEQFGKKSELPANAKLGERVKHYVTVVAVTTITLLITPLLFIYVFIKGLSKDKSISLSEFFGFREKIRMKDTDVQE